MSVALVYEPALADYRFTAYHPMKPERFTLAVELMRAWGLLAEDSGPSSAAPSSATIAPDASTRALVLTPAPATTRDLQLFHSVAYISAVQAASANPLREAPEMGLGDGDTPTFLGVHEAASLAVGATMLALDSVVDGTVDRAFNPAGGLHHAHRSRASGFCVYNDCAIAIQRATRVHEGLRVAYVDIDAHHGDGVEAAFSARRDVLTLSVHESGRFLFPGTGETDDIGTNDGVGYTLNVPLPIGADPACYELVFHEIIRPALQTFHPDVIVLQGGADSHITDPLTHLSQTVRGHVDLVKHIVDSAENLCDGRIVVVGGGGYQPFSIVPQTWAATMAVLLDREVPAELPDEWVVSAQEAAASYGLVLRAPSGTLDDGDLAGHDVFIGSGASRASAEETSEVARLLATSAIERLRRGSPLLGGGR